MEYVNLLRQMLGKDDAEFRDGQLEAIKRVLEGRRTLVVERTGWGKSIVYFLATKLLRDSGKGMTLIVSPLISLMNDQIQHAEDMGINVKTINSYNSEEHDELFEQIQHGNEIDALLVSPERLANQDFRELLLDLTDNIGFFVVDEAHCISDWGHDFRPDYRRIVEIISRLPSDVPVLATTATANDRVIEDIQEQIADIEVIRGALLRESLALQTIRIDSFAERLAWIGKNVDKFGGSGIIYCNTIAHTELLDRYLRSLGKRSAVYTGKLSAEEREDVIMGFKGTDDTPRTIDVVVATTALGMGFDMPDLKYVIHFEKPGNVIAYYQQIGRAGRDIDTAYAVLLYGENDDKVNRYFIDSAFPEDQLMEEIINTTVDNQNTGIKESEYEHYVNASRGAIQKALKFLDVEGDIYKEGTKYFKTPRPWNVDHERARRITERRYAELDQMNAYVETDECYMEYISRLLDDKDACRCGKCGNCIKKDIRDFEAVTPEEEASAYEFIQSDTDVISPRLRWPVVPEVRTLLDITNYNITANVQLGEGLCLSKYGNEGYGARVQRGKYRDGNFSDELVDASEEILRQFIQDNAISWIAYIPSLNHPTLVKSFAERLAAKLGIPCRNVLVKTEAGRQQKEFNNSFYQFENAYNTFDVDENELYDENDLYKENVLLVDDMVDSRWTLTVCGYKLMKKGSGKVYPYALANTSGNRSE